MPDLSPEAQRQVRTMQTILSSLLMGVITFAGVIYFVRASPTSPPTPGFEQMLLLMLFGVAGGCAIGSFVLRGIFMNNLREQVKAGAADIEVINKAVMPMVLIGGALAEGPALYGVIVYMLTDNVLSLIVPAAGLLAIAAQIPTVATVRRWLSPMR